jgi:hypothetical protein
LEIIHQEGINVPEVCLRGCILKKALGKPVQLVIASGNKRKYLGREGVYPVKTMIYNREKSLQLCPGFFNTTLKEEIEVMKGVCFYVCCFGLFNSLNRDFNIEFDCLRALRFSS